MSFQNTNTAKDHLGNQVKFSPNTKGTGTPHVPSSIQLRGKDFGLPATANPDAEDNRIGATFMSDPNAGGTDGSARVPNTFTQSKFVMPAVVNPAGPRDRSKTNVAPRSKTS